MKTFHPFSGIHALVLLAFCATTTGLVLRRRRLLRAAGPGAADRFDRRLGVATGVIWLLTSVVQFLPGEFDLTSSIPLHVCDFTIIAVPLALLTCWRPARAITYFWGIGLSTQGLITPDLMYGPSTLTFWVFWSAHFVIVGGAVYDVIARGYRPAWRDFAVAVGVGLLYVALVFPFDIATGLNYGYIGKSAPGQPSLVDALGTWPGRVGVMVGLGIVVMAALTLPWELARLIRARRAGTSRANVPAQAEIAAPGPIRG